MPTVLALDVYVYLRISKSNLAEMVICYDYDSWRQEGHPAVKPMPQIARPTVAGRSTVRAERPTSGN